MGRLASVIRFQCIHFKVYFIAFCMHYRYYAVVVVTGGGAVDAYDIGPYNEEEADTANSNGQPYSYIAGIVETFNISDYPYPYIVGDESRSNIGGVNYENVQLQVNAIYAVMIRAYTTDVLVSKMCSDRNTLII